jgi:hypothetical protein
MNVSEYLPLNLPPRLVTLRHTIRGCLIGLPNKLFQTKTLPDFG